MEEILKNDYQSFKIIYEYFVEQERRLVHEELKHCDDIWNEFCQFKLLGLLCKDDGLIYEINH